MKKTLFIIISLLGISVSTQSQNTEDYFIFVIEEEGSTTSFYANTLSFFEIDWENNNKWEKVTTEGLERISYKYVTAPDTIKIRGVLNEFRAPNDIIDVVQWGNVGFNSLKMAFRKCHKLVEFSATDTPNLSMVRSMNKAFASSKKFNGDLSNWDVSNITTMNNAFFGADAFNGDISTWDVSSVEDMRFMFTRAYNFNCDISNWDVSKVKNMRSMFNNAKNFNIDLSGWDISSAENINSMFFEASSFNQDLSGWNISNVYKMFDIFKGTIIPTKTYDKILISWASQDVQDSVSFAISTTYCDGDAMDARRNLVYDHNWNIKDHGPCDDYNFIFEVEGNAYDSIEFHAQSVNTFYVDWENNDKWEEVNTDSLLISVSHYFEEKPDTIKIKGDLNKFEAPKNSIDVIQWGDLAFTTMDFMFHKCKLITDFSAQDTPNLSRVSSMKYTFASTSLFNGDISNWDVSNVVSMRSTFANAKHFNANISDWDVSSVQNMKSLFYNASSFNSDISEWDVSSVTNMANMFYQTYQFTTDNYDNLLREWSKLPLQKNVKFVVYTPYCNSENERQSIVDNYGWEIHDGGSDCSSTFNSSNRTKTNGMIKDELDLTSGFFEGDIYWLLYDFNGNIIDTGYSYLKKGEKLKWWEFQKNFNQAGILKVYDTNERVSIIKFIKQP
ncbi:BspA family leucine-rich repeat surface protein [Flammeovirga aprica]|uniref:DUF285 domain-containing protein n=1 Tax=Flammeovirga aprica JL-4 TaxID=694437 RepID=A0A7X9XAK9_9BACT|nr:BspA family leucine-rich repeat surface protein [Flammeovirga aprica]NME69776.1 DUF285 domain-containing protein [Flammeovirga aprica JL-4]